MTVCQEESRRVSQEEDILRFDIKVQLLRLVEGLDRVNELKEDLPQELIITPKYLYTVDNLVQVSAVMVFRDDEDIWVLMNHVDRTKKVWMPREVVRCVPENIIISRWCRGLRAESLNCVRRRSGKTNVDGAINDPLWPRTYELLQE